MLNIDNTDEGAARSSKNNITKTIRNVAASWYQSNNRGQQARGKCSFQSQCQQNTSCYRDGAAMVVEVGVAAGGSGTGGKRSIKPQRYLIQQTGLLLRNLK